MDPTVVKSVICEVEKFVAITVVKLLVTVAEPVGRSSKLDCLTDVDGDPKTDEISTGDTTDELALALGAGSPVDGATDEVVDIPKLPAPLEGGATDAGVDGGAPGIGMDVADNGVLLILEVSSDGTLLEEASSPEDDPREPDDEEPLGQGLDPGQVEFE